MTEDHILTIDLGTTGCKIGIFDTNGSMISYSYSEYPLYSSKIGYAEQDPMEWWIGVKHCIKKAIVKSNVSPSKISIVGITGQSTSVVFLNKEGNPIRSSILYSDSRAEKFITDIEKIVGKLNYTEAKMFSNLLWIRGNEHKTYKHIWKVLDAKEFIAYKLTGEMTYDSIVMPTERLMHLSSILDVPIEFFGNPHDYEHPIGYTTRKISEEIGLLEGTPVIVGPWDGMCNVIGSGLMNHGEAMDVAGTTEIVAVVSDKLLPIITHKHVIKDLWLFYDSVPLGIAHKWLRDMMFNEFKALSDIDPYDVMNKLAENIEPGAEGMFFIPLFQGAFLKPHLKGSIVGVTVKHTRGHIVRSLLEGVAYSLRIMLEFVENGGLQVKEIRVSGGGAKSELWNQIKADVTGKEFKVIKVYETGCLGVAILAAVAIGIYTDIKEAIKNMVQFSYVVRPREDMHEKYNKYYNKYIKLLHFLDSFFID